MSLRDDLVALGIPEGCISVASSAHEKGCSFAIRPERPANGHPGDTIWRVHVDGCWFGDDTRKVDYLFWCQSASGRRCVLLVELKGGDFGRALEQIHATLSVLCHRSVGNILHGRNVEPGLRHEEVSAGGVQAHVVLGHGRQVPLQQKRREALRRRYGVLVYPHRRNAEVVGVDSLFRL